MNTTQAISNFFEQRRQEKHYDNVKAIPSNFSDDEKLEWIINESNITTLRLDIEMPYREMYKEAASLLPEFYAHRTDGESHAGWKSLVLHGRGKHITQGDDQYPNLDELPDMHWTEIADKCPVTTNFFKNNLPLDQYLRVRFMLLEPGGYILPHRDNDKNKLQAFNFALNNPDDCFFGMEGTGLVPRQSGDSRIINISTNHAVWNNSNTPRIHMIAHGWAKHKYKEYRDCVIRSYNKLITS